MLAADPLPALAPVTHRVAGALRCEESLLCSLAVIEFGAAGECGTAAMGLLYSDRQLYCTACI